MNERKWIIILIALLMSVTILVNAEPSSTISSSSPNNPPYPPEIRGPHAGKIREEHFYYFTTTDPDGNMLMTLEIDWGDGEIQREGGESCTIPWESGEELKISHRWNQSDDYSITARTQDVNGDWSEWSEPYEVTMPKNNCNFFIQWLQEILPFLF